MAIGTVERFNDSKGFGFISRSGDSSANTFRLLAVSRKHLLSAAESPVGIVFAPGTCQAFDGAVKP